MRLSVSTLLLGSVLLTFSACSPQVVTKSQSSLPDVVQEAPDSETGYTQTTVSIFRFNNFTDTPRAGMRAANIFNGLLTAYGYKTINHIKDSSLTLQEAAAKAKRDGSNFFIYGGVSEWRYKTGIDGEPAVSVQVSLYNTNNGNVVWSATGSDSDWGNGSIGTTAQELFEAILSE